MPAELAADARLLVAAEGGEGIEAGAVDVHLVGGGGEDVDRPGPVEGTQAPSM
jgi:hypothetical protein